MAGAHAGDGRASKQKKVRDAGAQVHTLPTHFQSHRTPHSPLRGATRTGRLWPTAQDPAARHPPLRFLGRLQNSPPTWSEAEVSARPRSPRRIPGMAWSVPLSKPGGGQRASALLGLQRPRPSPPSPWGHGCSCVSPSKGTAHTDSGPTPSGCPSFANCIHTALFPDKVALGGPAGNGHSGGPCWTSASPTRLPAGQGLPYCS